MKNIKFTIYTQGCKANQYDSAQLKKILLAQGFLYSEDKPDLVIINSCSVTKNSIKKCKLILNSIKNKFKKSRVVLFGCWPEVYKIKKSDLDIDLVWGTKRKDGLIKKIKKLMKSEGVANRNENEIASTDRSRYFIKIQDGCEQYCTYCVIPYARGKIKSRSEKEVIAEIRSAIKNGFKEIVLTGIHLGLYGKDKKRTNLSMLLNKLNRIEGIGRIRLSSIELNEVTGEIIKLIYKGKLCKHLHIPLQSGSDKILKLMNRPYTTKDFEKKIIQTKKIIPNIGITTDVIIGFPGEGEKEFKETINFIKKIKFSRLHVFPYSEHEKAPASKYPEKVKADIIKKRTEMLRDLGKKLEEEFEKKFKNKKIEIVVENSPKNTLKGKSSEYLDVTIKDYPNKFKTKDIVEIICT